MSKTVIVTGADGQDGSLMVDHILRTTDYTVYGTVRNAHNPFHFLKEALQNPRFFIYALDISNEESVSNFIQYVQPDYYLNFAAQTGVVLSKEKPEETFASNYLGVVYALRALRATFKDVRFFNAGSSEEFSPADYSPQDEKHTRRFNNPYGISKVLAHHAVEDYRELGMFAIQPYLYNHISTRSNPQFLPSRMAKEYAWMRRAVKEHWPFPTASFGNLEAERDWTSAEEVIEAIWLSLNAETPKDYVIASGQLTKVRSIVQSTFYSGELFHHLGPMKWEGDKLMAGNMVIADSDPKFFRENELVPLVGNPSAIKNDLGWQACKSVSAIMYDMIKKEIDTLEKGE